MTYKTHKYKITLHYTIGFNGDSTEEVIYRDTIPTNLTVFIGKRLTNDVSHVVWDMLPGCSELPAGMRKDTAVYNPGFTVYDGSCVLYHGQTAYTFVMVNCEIRNNYIHSLELAKLGA